LRYNISTKKREKVIKGFEPPYWELVKMVRSAKKEVGGTGLALVTLASTLKKSLDRGA
jgi:hypothetical protein